MEKHKPKMSQASGDYEPLEEKMEINCKWTQWRLVDQNEREGHHIRHVKEYHFGML